MKHYIKITETSERKKLDRTSCDICKFEWRDTDLKHPDVNYDYDQRIYQIDDKITISREIRAQETWENTGEGRDYSYDICPKCWEQKLTPFLKSLGAMPSIRTTDW